LSATNFAAVHDEAHHAARSPPACMAPSSHRPAMPQR
jgi:hypothetical protein